jgi:PiT family inorganic phosphate transporter
VGAALAAIGPAGVILPKWSEVEAVGKYAVVGLLFGLLAGVVAWALSRRPIPRRAIVPMSVVGALGLGVLQVRALPLPAVAMGAIAHWTLVVAIAVLVGALAGAILWLVTQRAMGWSLLPVVGGFGIVISIALGVLTKGIVLGKLTATILFMVLSPVLGFLAAFLLMSIVAWVTLGSEPGFANAWSKRLQLVSSAFYALTHGTNDGQKTMGVIAVLLVAAAAGTASASSLPVPTWVILASATAMGLGTLLGGQRIITTMATRITHLTPAQGFAASAAGGVVLAGMAEAGIPVSTTHAISGSIMGVGATRGSGAVRWGVGRRIVGAWVLTIPAAALVAFITYSVLRALNVA